MVADLVYIVGAMTVLSTVSVGVARFELGVPSAVCWAAVFPLLGASSAVGIWLKAGLGVDLFAVVGLVGIGLLSLWGFSAVAS